MASIMLLLYDVSSQCGKTIPAYCLSLQRELSRTSGLSVLIKVCVHELSSLKLLPTTNSLQLSRSRIIEYTCERTNEHIKALETLKCNNLILFGNFWTVSSRLLTQTSKYVEKVVRYLTMLLPADYHQINFITNQFFDSTTFSHFHLSRTTRTTFPERFRLTNI